MIDLDEEYIEGLYDDELTKMIIKIISDYNLTEEEKIKKIVEYMESEGIE